MSSPATSDKFNLSTWQCPHCQRWYDGAGCNNNGASTPLFYRGTCRHDVCVTCIAQVLSRASKKVKSEVDEGQPIIVAVTCPIIIDHDRRRRCNGSRTCQGQFHVKVADIPVVNNNNMVIDLCDDEKVTVSTAGTVKVKREKKVGELLQPSGHAIVPVKNKAFQPDSALATSGSVSSSGTQASSTPNSHFMIKSPLPVTNVGNLKPLFNEGDDVYAGWWDTDTDETEVQWYPGRVVSYKSISSSKYGPTRLYYIKYDDDYELDNVPDHFVWSKSDYELNAKFGKNYIGVRTRKDKTSKDKWAKDVGWYEITGEDGKVQSFSTLTDAMRAHDAIVVREHGARAKRSFLNIPEDYEELFASITTRLFNEEGDSVDARRSNSQVSTNVVSPDLGSIKSEPKCYAEESLFHGENMVDTQGPHEVKRRRLDSALDEEKYDKVTASTAGTVKAKSKNVGGLLQQTGQAIVPVKNEAFQHDRFLSTSGAVSSSGTQASSTAGTVKIKREKNAGELLRARIWQEVKRRSLEKDFEEKLECTNFWSVKKDSIQFTNEALMKKTLFHLNSFVDSNKQKNEGFSELIREGIATPGFLPLPYGFDIEKISDWTYKELRKALIQKYNVTPNWDISATATALWLKEATVGSFVIMRHCYPECKFCPKRLIVNGTYIGPVYVIGIITKKVVPWSEEERDIAHNYMGDFSRNRWPIHNICRVSWKWMGEIKELKKSTRDYLNKVVQPTLQQICADSVKTFYGGGTSESIRKDLWKNATIMISSDDFPDIFEHEGIPDRHIDQLLQVVCAPDCRDVSGDQQ